jgi:hypothetical protein
MSPYPDEVWLADLGLAAKTRPLSCVAGLLLLMQRAWVGNNFPGRGSYKFKSKFHERTYNE